MSAAADARRYHVLPSPFAFRRGGALHGAQLAYETWGTLNGARSNAVLVLTGLSPGAHAASSDADPSPGWWEYMIGPGKPIDTHRWYVICVNNLGSCRGSTGPDSPSPDDGLPLRRRFPALTVEDIAAATATLIDGLAIGRLACLIGPSMGSMTALALLLARPRLTRTLVLISGAPRSTPFALALRSIQREAITSDPQFHDGRYTPAAFPLAGMRLARKLGVVTYRSAAEWSERFGREPLKGSQVPAHEFASGFQIESYLERHAERFAPSFDPLAYLQLSRAMDWFDLDDHGGTRAAVATFDVDQALVIGVDSDLLFPVDQQRELADALAAAGIQTQFRALPSIQGHDAFLVDSERFAPAMAHFLCRLKIAGVLPCL